MSAHKTHKGQSFFDIAVQHFGESSLGQQIAELNGMSVTAEPTDTVILPEADLNPAVIKSMRKIPATGYGTDRDALWYDGFMHDANYLFLEMVLNN
jgi:hypothetical protein